MGRLALRAGWVAALLCPVAWAARTPEPKPASALRSLLAAAGVEGTAQIPVPPATPAPQRDHVADRDSVVFDCLANPRGQGSSAVLAVAQLQACRACESSGEECRFICLEVVNGQRLPTPISHGFCH